jgi:hypothetical protein
MQFFREIASGLAIPLLFAITFLQSNTTYAQTEKNPLESPIISSFMTGLQPETPKQAVELWILGCKK